MKPDSPTIAELVQRIVAVANPVRIILFGSAAREEMTPDSDLDVLVVVPEGQHRRRTAGKIYMNLIGFGTPVDVVVATEDDLQRYGDNFSLVYYPVLREGKEVYAAS
ncbi:nucleotidyltransferase domain-containing protein [Myxacorys almedinensis]|uniref:Nucleotidyltransferase domain-containing protein n=1 Tax=Myxacorys almedinensis A TaxID=2690445 RepID=A0A8J7Z542_9CYAN|nr:nucleotidyltransferase domain-containing protein [Myxacorys almedinensis]NDJ18346.1 nucleotidyltransferase domain-containing protein [Myxacorys almedinensis A]